MASSRGRSSSRVRLFAPYALITLLPVVALGMVLAGSYRANARRRGIAEGRAEAQLVAQTAVEPLLDQPLSEGLTPPEIDRLRRLVGRAVTDRHVLRLRVRDVRGRVVFSDDGSGFNDQPEDEALDAARGQVVARLTRLNTDRNDTGPTGVTAVEVYQPLRAGSPSRVTGVLEMYLPYAPISHEVGAGLHLLYAELAAGLAALYLALFAISVSVSRGLRRQLAINSFMAEHDALTQLPNRTLFHRRATTSLAASAHDGRTPVIAIVDLDRFKEINDTLGHHNGDRLLVELAERLSAEVGPADTVARLGGDEFGIVLADAHDPARQLRQLRDLLHTEIDVNGLPVSVEASVGFALAPDDGIGVDELLQHADVAMYVAKSQHAGVVRYDRRQDHYDATNLGLLAELRHAIDDEQLVLHYQPKVTLAGAVESVEALVRWEHPTLGLLGPDRFVPLAEQTEVIDRLTTWVLSRALADLRYLRPDLGMAVNVSARNLGRPDFAARVAALLAESGTPARRLTIEITETALLADPRNASAVLVELAVAGVHVSLDDFGCGYTSLGYLSSLPVHELKIDKTFVGDMVENPAHAAIVRSVVDLGHNLGLRVVGEGVEHEAARAALGDIGCDVAQGYLFARPMPLRELRRWLSPASQSRFGAPVRDREPASGVGS